MGARNSSRTRPAARSGAPVRQGAACAVDYRRHHRHAASHGRSERTDVESLRPGASSKVPSGKKLAHALLGPGAGPASRRAGRPPSLWRSTNSEPIRFRQETGHRAIDADSRLITNEESRRQRRFHDDTVQIARVVGDHDARVRRQLPQARHVRRTPSTGRARRAEAMRQRTAPLEPRHDQREQRGEPRTARVKTASAHTAVGGGEHAAKRATHLESSGGPVRGAQVWPVPGGFCELLRYMVARRR